MYTRKEALQNQIIVVEKDTLMLGIQELYNPPPLKTQQLECSNNSSCLCYDQLVVL